MDRVKRTSAKKKAKELTKYLRKEKPDYDYMKVLFKHLRNELDVKAHSRTQKTSRCTDRRRNRTIL